MEQDPTSNAGDLHCAGRGGEGAEEEDGRSYTIPEIQIYILVVVDLARCSARVDQENCQRLRLGTT